jgi:hypothetical protein
MKKTLVLLALATSGLAFADAPASAQPQQKAQTPASQPAKALPAKPEVKLVCDKDKDEKKDEVQNTPVADKEKEEPQTPATTTPALAKKAKMVMVADQKCSPSCTCPKKDKEEMAGEKDAHKPATAGKTSAPKIALA